MSRVQQQVCAEAKVKHRNNCNLSGHPARLSSLDTRLNATPPLTLQAKLVVSRSDDPLEREADQVADLIMRMPEPRLQRKAGEVEKLLRAKLSAQRRVASSKPGLAEAPPIVHEVLRSQGQPLDPSTRQFMESRFGYDFRQVRVHTNAKAAKSARAINARAYTVGQDIVIGSREYTLNSSRGQYLLAHELTHVLQQRSRFFGGDGQLIHRAVECDEFGVCQSVPDPVGAMSMIPPGDCTPGEHRTLQDEVNRACKGSRRRCLSSDSCPTIWQKIESNSECIRARSVINARCFRGGDIGHNQAVMAAVGALNNCWSVYNQNCQDWSPPVPVPERVAERRPVIDRGFMDRMAEITGLTGAALVIYLIVSEGSRLFPPRNLVPVP